MKKKIHKLYKYFYVFGRQNMPERFYTFGFADSDYLPPDSEGYIIYLSRGVTKREATKRLKGCPLIKDVIGDIRIYDKPYEHLNNEHEMAELYKETLKTNGVEMESVDIAI